MTLLFIVCGVCATAAVGMLCEKISPLAAMFIVISVGAALKSF